MEQLIACFKEVSEEEDPVEILNKVVCQVSSKPNAERTKNLFQSLKDEFERKGNRTKKGTDDPAGG